MNKKVGGIAARKGEGPLWQFTDKNNGSFIVPDADYISRLFFPLINRQAGNHKSEIK